MEVVRAGLNALRPSVRQGRRVDNTRRDALLDRLQELILGEGFTHLTMDDIAARLQCSKSTLYAISPSKEQLVLTVLKHFFRDATARIDESVADISDPTNQIAAYLAAVGTEMQRMSQQCYTDMVTHRPTLDVYVLNSRAAARRVREYVQQGISDGVFRAVHAQFVGEAVTLLIEGVQQGELLSRTGLSSVEAYTELSNLVLASLAKPEPATP